MKKFLDYKDDLEELQEGFTNLLPHHGELKRKHVDAVWDMLQHSYAKIGGIHGSGFSSKEDMIAKIPMWKIGKTGGRVNSVVLYKDKEGRKSVAAGTDGSVTPSGTVNATSSASFLINITGVDTPAYVAYRM